jgi:aryl-alcohol dehydrogenase-like predicted oxidoreductase
MRLPMIGSGESARVDDDKAVELMHHAFKAGINFIDSAVFY